ncbi:MAG: hypothetical protein AAF360_06100 [Pseudomonadota bacterium]
MEIKIAKDARVRVNKTTQREFPAGWKGEVDDATAKALAEQGAIEKPKKPRAPKADDDKAKAEAEAKAKADAEAKAKAEAEAAAAANAQAGGQQTGGAPAA